MDAKKVIVIIALALGILFHWSGKQLSRHNKENQLEVDSFVNFVIPKLKEFIPNLFLWDRTFIDKSKYPEKTLVTTNTQNSIEVEKSGSPNNLTPGSQNGNAPLPGTAPQVVNPNLAQRNPAPVNKNQNTGFEQVHSENVDQLKTFQNQYSDGDNNEAANKNISENEYDNKVNPIIGPPSGVDDDGKDQNNQNTLNNANTNGKKLEDSIHDWKNKFTQDPTKEVMNEFVNEYKNGKINKRVFYQVESELIKENNPTIQNLMIYGLASTPSEESLALLIESKDVVGGSSNSYYKTVLDTYAKEDKLKILIKNLNHSKPEIVLGTIPLVVKVGGSLITWTSDFSSHSSNSNEMPRDRRGHSTGVPRKSLVEITTALNSLLDSDNQQIAIAAQEALQKLDFQPGSTN